MVGAPGTLVLHLLLRLHRPIRRWSSRSCEAKSITISAYDHLRWSTRPDIPFPNSPNEAEASSAFLELFDCAALVFSAILSPMAVDVDCKPPVTISDNACKLKVKRSLVRDLPPRPPTTASFILFSVSDMVY